MKYKIRKLFFIIQNLRHYIRFLGIDVNKKDIRTGIKKLCLNSLDIDMINQLVRLLHGLLNVNINLLNLAG